MATDYISREAAIKAIMEHTGMFNEVHEQIDRLFKRVCILEDRLSPPEKVVEKVIE